VPMKKPKAKIKKVKKKAAPKAPPIDPIEYFIEEWPTSMTTADMQARCDEVGLDGWELVEIGQYGSPGTVRVWFKRKGF